MSYSPVPNNRRGVMIKGGPIDNLNIINEGGGAPNKIGGLKIVHGQLPHYSHSCLHSHVFASFFISDV